MNTIVTHKSFIDQLKDIRSYIDTLIIHYSREERSDEILKEIIESVFGFTWEKVISKERTKELVIARQMYCYFSYHHFNNNKTKIGKTIGGRDHTTIIHAIRATENMIETKDILYTEPYHKIQYMLNQLSNERSKD